jgi:peptidoglycan/xylan/chitin deacetylase (PgdA/CDA1 family)
VLPASEDLEQALVGLRSGSDALTVRKPVLSFSTINPAMIPTRESQRSSEDFVLGVALGPDSHGSFEPLHATYSNLRKTGRRTKLVIFGVQDGRLLASNLAREGLGPDPQWVSDESSTRDLLEACDVLVSLQDGVPLLVLRAISSHIPVITTAVRVPEAIRNRRTVKFIRRGDQNGLEEALLGLSEQPKRTPIPGFVSEGSIAKYYSDTYLWRENGSPSASGDVPKGRALIKRVLLGALPSGRLLRHGSRDRTQIALTVDDGPDPVFTPRILDIFRDHAVKATFFVVGGAAEQYPEIVLRMKREGHDVGSHSYSHPYFHRLSWSGAIREIGMTRWVLKRILGEECKLFRPPHGKLSLRSLVPAWAAGQQVVIWNVDLKDYRAGSGEVEAQLDRTVFASGDIILYHGTSEPALKALPRVIEAALNKGREAVTISHLVPK